MGLHLPPALAASTFTVGASGGSWGKILNQSLFQPFGKKHGLTVRHDVKGNVQRLLELVANPGESGIDAVELSGSRIALAVGNNLLEPLNPDLIPNYAHVPDAFKNRYWAGSVVCPITIVYNPKHVSAEEARSWEALINPKFKGHVGVPAYTWQGENWFHAVNLLLGGAYENVTPGIDFAKKVMQNGGTIIQSPDHGLKQFEAGNLWVAAFLRSRANSPAGKAIGLKSTFVENWWPLSPGFGIVRGAANPELAADFVNMALRPEHGLALGAYAGCAPTNRQAEIPPDLQSIEIPKEELGKAAILDYGKMFQVGQEVLARWNREVIL